MSTERSQATGSSGRASDSLPPVREGHERGYLGCTDESCHRPYYYDYEPRSLSTPVYGLCHGPLVSITRHEFDERAGEMP